MGNAMNSESKHPNENPARETPGLFTVLKAAFRRIAVPEHAEEAVERLFSSLPFCWEDVEADFPSLNRRDGARHLLGRLDDADLGTLYETLFALHPGLKYTMDPKCRLDRPPEEQAKAYLAACEHEESGSDGAVLSQPQKRPGGRLTG